jgi:tetratricopeptide (TPR) repeat protein
LHIFEQVCQTLAYAHARGIIHRDLKPQNIMVGAFGEVQVMDWGLAKVLAYRLDADDWGEPAESNDASGSDLDAPDTARSRGETVTGEVMGTPGYLAPEQARGNIRDLDARCDVFGLGALLCEMLTGQPPFAAGSRQANLRLAVQGDLSDAFARLECVADTTDGELVMLARACLAPNRERRPADAGAVAEAVARYQAGLQQRLKQAEITRAAALARAEEEQKRRVVEQDRARAEQDKVREERKRRRVQLYLAAALVTLVTTTAGALVWWAQDQSYRVQEELLRQTDRQRRQQQQEKDIAAALGQARKARQELHTRLGRPGGVRELLNRPADWRQLIAAARASLQFSQKLQGAVEDPVPPTLVSDIEALAKKLDQDEIDYHFDRRLEMIREDRSSITGARFNHARAAHEYLSAFQETGLVPHPGREKELAAKIRQSPIHEQLLAALDDWAGVAWQEGKQDQQERILHVARLADHDHWRDQLRDPAIWSNAKLLQKLADKALAEPDTLKRLSPQMLDLLGTLLLGRADVEGWYRRALALHPADFWLNFDLGNALYERKPQQAEGFFRAALGVRPDSTAVWNNLGIALFHQRNYRGAIEAYQTALRLQPRNAHAHVNWGAALAALRDFDGTIQHCRLALDLDPNAGTAHYNWGLALRVKKDYAGAIAHLQKALDIDPKDAQAHLYWGLTLVAKRDFGGAIEQYKKALAIVPRYATAHTNWGDALAAQGDFAGAVEHYQKALAVNPRHAMAHIRWGMGLQDRKQVKEALAHLQAAVELDPNSADAHQALGLVLKNVGQFDEAIKHFQRAVQLHPYFAEAHILWGTTLGIKGDLDGAIKHFQAALAIDPAQAQAHYNWGLALHNRKDFEGAIEHYRQAAALDPSDRWVLYNWGLALKAQRNYKAAIVQFQKALALNPCYVKAHINWGTSLAATNDLEGAIEQYRLALKIDPTAAEGYYNWGITLRDLGHFAEALQRLQRAHEMGSQRPGWRLPSAEAVAECQQLLKLDQHLGRVLDDQAEPGDARTQLALAQLCRQFKKCYAAAARFYAAALAADPNLAEDARSPLRQHAAGVAALAACGQGRDANDLGAQDRAKLRRQALNWLREDLAVLAQQVSASTTQPAGSDVASGLLKQLAQQSTASPTEVVWAIDKLSHWQNDPDLAGLRDEKELTRLPPEEQVAWRRLWANVRVLRKKAGGCFREQRLSGSLTARDREKVHVMTLQAGKTYVFDLQSTTFNTLLRLVDDKGRVLDENNDIEPGINQNSRIVFTATMDGTYNLIAAVFEQQGAGDYMLIIREFTGKKK